MQLSTNYIKKIQKYIENPIIGLSLYVFIFIYNLYGLIILENKKNKPTKIHPTARVHPSACISLYGVQIGKNVIIGKKAVYYSPDESKDIETLIAADPIVQYMTVPELEKTIKNTKKLIPSNLKCSNKSILLKLKGLYKIEG